MIRTSRRCFIGAAAAAGFTSGAGLAQGKPIRVLVGFAAGGGNDVIARLVAQKLGEGSLGQQVLVDNKTGASGLIAADILAKSAPDGMTLMVAAQTTYAVAPQLYNSVAFDAPRDVAGISLLGASPLVLVVNPSFAAKSVADLIEMARARPGTINFGSGGVGTTPHMAAELFLFTSGIRMTHVAYRGEAPAINDLVGGQLHLIFANLSAVIGNVRAGSLRALAVTGAERSPAAPDIPTVAEAALPGFEAATWFALAAPASTPRDIVVRLNRNVQHAFAQADTRQRFAEIGMTVADSTPEGVDALIRAEIAKWSTVIQEAGIKAPE
jgi:tripartite-type tricarboxylate transporter receptor subunit TctC